MEARGANGQQSPPPPGRATLADVAAEAGVSAKTVSRVLNAEGSVRPDTAARVWDAAARLRYRRNENAANLRRRWEAAVVGLVVDDVTHPASAVIARAAEAVGREHGYVLLVAMSGDDPAQEDALLRGFCRRGVNGLLVVPSGGADHSFLKAEIAAGIPVVFIERPGGNLRADSVVTAHADGVREGVSHLLCHGHRRIAFVGGPVASFVASERQRGYREAMAGAEVPVDPDLVRLDVSGAGAAHDAVEAFLAMPDPPTAVFAAGTWLTIGAIRAVRDGGGGIAVVGFDDLQIGDLLPVPVTVVERDIDAIGRTAAELLLRRMDGDRRPATQITLGTELVIRGPGEVPT